MIQRQCRDCGETKPVTEFYTCKTRKDGYRSECKDCTKKQSEQWAEANQDRKKANDQRRRQTEVYKLQHRKRGKERRQEQIATDPGFRAKERVYLAEWRKKHRDELNEKSRRRREKNLEHHRQIGRECYWRYVEKNRDDSRLYKASLKCPENLRITLNEFYDICAAFENKCCYCDTPDDLTVEHLTPFNKGGRNEIGNVAIACDHCNKSKKNKLLEEFAPDRAMTIRRKAMLL